MAGLIPARTVPTGGLIPAHVVRHATYWDTWYTPDGDLPAAAQFFVGNPEYRQTGNSFYFGPRSILPEPIVASIRKIEIVSTYPFDDAVVVAMRDNTSLTWFPAWLTEIGDLKLPVQNGIPFHVELRFTTPTKEQELAWYRGNPPPTGYGAVRKFPAGIPIRCVLHADVIEEIQ